MNKVILLSPPFKKFQFGLYRLGESLSLGYLASYLEENGHVVEILEPSLERLSITKTAEYILKNDFFFVGFTVPCSGLYPNVLSVANILRNKGFEGHINLGGHFPTFEHNDILRYSKNINSVIRHEGEVTLLELINNLENKNLSCILGLSYRDSGKIFINSSRPTIKNLDALPFPKRSKYSLYHGNKHFSMITSRGCPGNCSFCSVRAFYDYDSPLWRCRSPENVVDEIEYLVDKYRANLISFLDDNFIGSGKFGEKRAISIANEIVNRDLNINFAISCRVDGINNDVLEHLKKAGLCHVSLGIESGNEEILNRFNKNTTVSKNISSIEILRKNNLGLDPFFIMFDPWTSIKEIQENIKFLYENNLCRFATVSNAILIYKGTPLFEKLKQNLKRVNWEYKYSFVEADVATIFYLINSLKEMKYLDKMLDTIAYHCDLQHINCHMDVERLIYSIRKQINEFVYTIMLEIINYVINKSPEEELELEINRLKELIKIFVDSIRVDYHAFLKFLFM